MQGVLSCCRKSCLGLSWAEPSFCSTSRVPGLEKCSSGFWSLICQLQAEKHCCLLPKLVLCFLHLTWLKSLEKTISCVTIWGIARWAICMSTVRAVRHAGEVLSRETADAVKAEAGNLSNAWISQGWAYPSNTCNALDWSWAGTGDCSVLKEAVAIFGLEPFNGEIGSSCMF